MKAKLKAKILGVEKNAEHKSDKSDMTGMTKIRFTSMGKVDTNLINAKMTFLDGELFVREAIAADMKIGATITINISDEEPDDGPIT
jgi:hypothetical protein